jgi:hypothetical protein
MKPDERSFRIALVADRFVNPPPGGLDGLAAAAQAGWGVMQLPAADYPAALAARILAEIAEQAEEFSRHGYDFVVVGECDGLAPALAAVGVSVPDQITPTAAADLLDFLTRRPAVAARQWARLGLTPAGAGSGAAASPATGATAD